MVLSDPPEAQETGNLLIDCDDVKIWSPYLQTTAVFCLFVCAFVKMTVLAVFFMVFYIRSTSRPTLSFIKGCLYGRHS